MSLFYSTMLYNYWQKLFDLLAEKRKTVPSPSKCSFFPSLWLAHQPFGTVCSRKFSAAVGGFQDFSSRSRVSTVQKLRGDWSSSARSQQIVRKQQKPVVGRVELSRTCVLVKVIFGKGSWWPPAFPGVSYCTFIYTWEQFKITFTVIAPQSLYFCLYLNAPPFPALGSWGVHPAQPFPDIPSSRNSQRNSALGGCTGQGQPGKLRIRKNE